MLIEDYVLEYIVSPSLVHATNLLEAKKIIEANSWTKFDLVMLDLTLPDGDGTSLITEIVELCVECPIIVLTGYSDFEFSVKSLGMGVSDYLLKDELTPLSLYKSIIYNIERKKTQSELKASQRRYSNLFHLSPDPTWVYDVESNKFLDVNEAAVCQYGFTHEEFMSMTIDHLEPGHHSEVESTPPLPCLYEMDKPNQKEIYRHRKKNGEVILVENHKSEILFHGKPAHIMWLMMSQSAFITSMLLKSRTRG